MTPDSTARIERAAELHRRGVQALQGQRAAVAVECIGEALRLDPTSVPACVNYGTALHELRRFEEAVQSCDRAIALDPACAPAFYNRGNALRELRRHAAAVASYDQAIALQATHVEAYLNRGLALADLGRHDEAVASYDRAIALQPQHPDPHFNRANQLRHRGRLREALAGYDRALALQPGFAGAHLNRGTVLVELRRHPEAMLSFDRAIACQPTLAEAHFNRGGALQHLGQYIAAVASYDKGLVLDPHNAQAHADRGRALRELRRHEEAILSYDRALALDPGATELRCARRHLQMQIADWRGLEDDLGRITASIDNGHAVSNPFFLLPLCDAPPLQRRAAERWTAAQRPGACVPDAMAPPAAAGRIHIGYFSADFHEHATSYLIAQLFELHDRSRFRITALSFGPPSSSAMRRRLHAACDEFIDVRSEADADIATRARRLAIDIAVDLKGFTQDSRIGIFAHRAAPLQVNFLGYPGTLGAPFMDYLIADRTLIPEGAETGYAEKIIFLPDSYQVNDATRAIASKTYTRRELHLPDAGFVFCCFNNAYKILPATFECWMRILRQVEGSVLWLLGDNAAMIRNLRREAANRGVSRERLIFASRTDLAAHLARHAGADLFLDTLPCNAHTTASDALWAGLPVLTCPGGSFAARVAASLLQAIGLPELIAPTPQRYEEIAVALATDPEALAAVRSRLRAQRLSAPLFDTPRYCRHLEQAFADIDARRRAGLPPEHRPWARADRAHSDMHSDLAARLQRAVALHGEGMAAEAALLYRSILAEQPSHPDALHLLGVAEIQQGRPREGLAWIERSLAVDPRQPAALANQGNGWLALQEWSRALTCYEASLRHWPDYAAAVYGRGNALSALGRFTEALGCFERALDLAPQLAPALVALGGVLRKLHRPADALTAYDRALACAPQHADTWVEKGHVLAELGQTAASIVAYEHALTLNPTHAAVWFALGVAQSLLSNFRAASESLRRALALDPQLPHATGACLHADLQRCDWRDHAPSVAALVAALERDEPADFPLSLLSVCDSPPLQLRCAARFAGLQRAGVTPLPPVRRHDATRLRIAYLSADFLEHPTAYLMAGVFEEHDRQRFEITGVSLRDDARSPTARFVCAAFDHVIRAEALPDAALAGMLRERRVDIVVDLMGFTGAHRARMLALRPAPVQVNYLGFPATTGSPDIDYLIADDFLIPEAAQDAYSEKIAYLPDCFQANDGRRPGARAPTRVQMQLPPDARVFCSFHSSHKLNPSLFDVWSRLLLAVPGSVLWLVSRQEEVAENLRREAGARGVAPERLVFAPAMSYPDHLARLALADLCLDTLPFNGGTTTSDALWAGVPVVTCAGRSYAARMSGSLLRAVGLPDLVTESLGDYERLALQLAREPQRLAAARAALAVARGSSALFDTGRFCRHFEAALALMSERQRRGLPPATFRIAAQDPEGAAADP